MTDIAMLLGYAQATAKKLQAENDRLRAALEHIAGKNDLEGVAPDDEPSAAYAALHECEIIAREALGDYRD